MKPYLLATLLVTTAFAAGAQASPPATAAAAAVQPSSAMPSFKDVQRRILAQQCAEKGREKTNFNISFNITADSFADARKKYEEQLTQIDAIAKKQGIEKFELQSSNYNMRSQRQPRGDIDGKTEYYLSGNLTYVMDSADSAFKLGDVLTQQKFQVTISGSKYKNSCDTVSPAINE